MIRPATLVLGILCASAIGTAYAQQERGSQQQQTEQPQQSAQNKESDRPLERAIDDAHKLKTLLQKLGDLLAERFARGGRLPPELEHSVCDTARQVAELESLLDSDIYRAAVDQIQRTGGPGPKEAEDALEEAKGNVRALVNAITGWVDDDEPISPMDCPEFPPDYKPTEEPPPRKLGVKPGELRPTEQVMVRRETGRPTTPVELIPAPWTVTVATDGVKWCTFSQAQGVATVLTPTNAEGNLIAGIVPDNPVMTPGTTPRVTKQPSTGPSTPKAVTERPKKIAPSPLASVLPRAPASTTPTADNPPPASTSPSDTPPAKTPGHPRTTDQTPPPSERPAPPTGDGLSIPEQVTIDFNEKVDIKELAENLKLATAEPSTALKLKPLTPDLPGSGDKSTQDKGSDKDPATGRMGSDGHARITTNEPQAYRLPSTPGAPTHYRAEIDTPEHSGFVAETTGKPVKAAELASVLPAGIKATIDTVRFGGQTHTRLGLDWPRSQKVDPTALADSVSRAIGAKLGIDTCRRTKPAPASGPEPTSVTASNNAVPASTIKLPSTVEVRRTR